MSEFGSFRRHIGAIPFELVMLGGAVVTFAKGDMKHMAASLFTLSLSFLPFYIEKRFRVKLSILLQTIYVAFVFSSMFAGEVLGMYGRIWVWDDIVHFISGLLVGLAVMFWFILFARRRREFPMPIWFQAVTIVCVCATIAVLWEIAEFTSDQLFGTFSQGDDLYDTMIDLSYGLISGSIMAGAWVLHVKYKKAFVVSLFLAHFERLNPDQDTKLI
jgi:hypothetical protein